jgi:hypothetical protein
VFAALTNRRTRNLETKVKTKTKSFFPVKEEPLTRDESKASYAIIRHNIRTYESGGVVLVVKGRENAEIRVKHFETGQSSEDRHAGWRYFVEKSDLKAGMDPTEATNLRQMKLEIRESQAVPEPTPLANPPRQS